MDHFDIILSALSILAHLALALHTSPPSSSFQYLGIGLDFGGFFHNENEHFKTALVLTWGFAFLTPPIYSLYLIPPNHPSLLLFSTLFFLAYFGISDWRALGSCHRKHRPVPKNDSGPRTATHRFLVMPAVNILQAKKKNPRSFSKCGGLYESGPCGFIIFFFFLNTWSPVDETVWKILGSVALSEEVCHCEWALMFQKPMPGQCLSLPACGSGCK